MGLRVNTNIASINAHRHLGKQQMRNEHALSALASGSRIVRSADDAAGLAQSEYMKGQLAGQKMARYNAFNAMSLVQVSEGGLNELSNILIRVRELGVQAASDNVSDVERGFLNVEVDQLLKEADRIANTTQFGTKKLLDGSGKELEFHVGAYAGQENIIKYNLNADARASTIGIDGITVLNKDSARDGLAKLDSALVKINKMRADFGAVQSRLQVTTSNLDIQNENLAAAKSRLSDADVAYETAELASSNILQQAAVGVLAQANQSQNAVLKLI
ncbi:MAG: flagellin FliC [Oligoflexia bacterium]|nr:flagellin FliC [Oligoflexia bacterium]